MKKRWIFVVIAFLIIGFISCAKETGFQLSGTLKEGLRVITIDARSDSYDLHVYGGDYVVFSLKNNSTATLEIPELNVSVSLPMNDPEVPYIKFKTPGLLSFSLNNKQGTITVHEYKKLHYSAVTAKEAKNIIKEHNPLVLDVRTAGEYNRGHLKDALLIPVQQLQKRIKELDKYKNKPILIYCATGNRSTVASKILQDAGFKEIYNLRSGISGWGREGYEIVQ